MLLGLYVLYKEEDTTVQSIQNHCKLSSLGRETEFSSSQSPLYYIGCSHMRQLLRENITGILLNSSQVVIQGITGYRNKNNKFNDSFATYSLTNRSDIY